jgi:hypothetical protein
LSSTLVVEERGTCQSDASTLPENATSNFIKDVRPIPVNMPVNEFGRIAADLINSGVSAEALIQFARYPLVGLNILNRLDAPWCGCAKTTIGSPIARGSR